MNLDCVRRVQEDWQGGKWILSTAWIQEIFKTFKDEAVLYVTSEKNMQDIRKGILNKK